MNVANLLRKIKLSEISLVDAPANSGARVAFYKSKGEPGMARNVDLSKVVNGDAEDLRKAGFLVKHAGAIKFTKKAYVELATQQARELMKRHDGAYPSVEVARAAVWERNPDLKQAYDEAPREPVDTAEPKPLPAMQTATEKAVELRKAHPETYKSLEAARAEVWEQEPHLRDQLRTEMRQAAQEG